MPRVDFKYTCPRCGGSVIWHMNDRRIGASSRAFCTNNVTASRFDWSIDKSIICDWEGEAVRKYDGTIEVYADKGKSKILLPTVI